MMGMAEESIKKTLAQNLGEIGQTEVKRIFERNGWTVHGLDGSGDFGEDQLVRVFIGGTATELSFFVQVKATKRSRKSNKNIQVRIKTAHLDLWHGHTIPVFLVLWNEEEKNAYWSDIHAYVQKLDAKSKKWNEKVTHTLSQFQVLDSHGLETIKGIVKDWYVKFALQNVQGVSEIASYGGFQKQYQINIDPNKLSYYKLTIQDVMRTVKSNNNEAGGRKFEMSGIGQIIKTTGYLKSIQEIENLSVRTQNSIPVKIRDIGTVQMAGESRLGIFDYNGTGEAVGGIVVLRYGENADEVIKKVKTKMLDVAKGFPQGMKFNIVYDRSELIEESISSIKTTLIEEMIVVSLIVIAFLFHWRSAVSIIIQIPITIAASFIVLNAFDISSNIMSLTGIALAIGVIVDNGIIMAENSYKNLAVRQAELNEQLKGGNADVE